MRRPKGIMAKAVLPVIGVMFACGAAFGGEALAQAKWNMGGSAPQGAGASPEIEEAKSNYQLYCAQCHGQKGDGASQLGSLLDPPPANHTDPARMSKASDDKLFKTISEGGAAVGLSEGMPPHNTTLGPGQIKGLVKYLRILCGCEFKEGK